MVAFLKAIHGATAVGLLVLAGRFTGVQAVQLLDLYRIDGGAQVGSEGPSAVATATTALKSADARRDAELKALRDQLGTGGQEHAGPAASGVVLRRILVDWGPPRSEVYLGSERVGQTPFGGQISCEAGTQVEVTVLPAVGAPLKRRIPCGAATVESH